MLTLICASRLRSFHLWASVHRQMPFFIFGANINEPRTLVAGDSTSWVTDHSSYPSPTWTLTYEFRGPSKMTVTATQSGTTSSFAVAVTSVASDALVDGIYQWQAIVTNGSERHTIWSGTLEVLPKLADETEQYDAKSHVRTVLNAIESALESYAKNPYQSLSIAGRNKQWSLEELLKMRTQYKYYLEQEIQAEKAAQGLARGRYLTRFVRPS